MKYTEFKDTFLRAFEDCGFSAMYATKHESIDLGTTDRTFTINFTFSDSPIPAKASVSWCWDALETARTTTSERCMHMTLFKSQRIREIRRTWLRMEIELRIGGVVGRPLRFPISGASRREPLPPLTSAMSLVTCKVPGGRHVALARQESPELTLTWALNDNPPLEVVTVRGFQGIELPRPCLDRRKSAAVANPYAALVDMFARLRSAQCAWGQALAFPRVDAPTSAQ